MLLLYCYLDQKSTKFWCFEPDFWAIFVVFLQQKGSTQVLPAGPVVKVPVSPVSGKQLL